ncbi:hypothetical protein BDN72DRAFT_153343 [Pluteus cervinus]|uniref:Uncharacterized protein n=1 Tax=Pluteus cervinus TaxID=181527 RepID=A0ACD3AKV6_9AGAR|nr:hypothetical protein BDN72DRAFT_153343 [Pluteus cervinus]
MQLGRRSRQQTTNMPWSLCGTSTAFVAILHFAETTGRPSSLWGIGGSGIGCGNQEQRSNQRIRARSVGARTRTTTRVTANPQKRRRKQQLRLPTSLAFLLSIHCNVSTIFLLFFSFTYNVHPRAISTPILAPIQTATSSQNPSDAGYPRPRPANASRQVATPSSSSSTTTPTTASTTPSGSTPPSTTPAHANNEDQGTEKQALTESTAGPGTIDDGDEGNQSRPAPELTPPEPTTSEIRAEVAPASPQLSTALQTGDDAPQNEPQRQITMATDFFANIPSPQPSPQTTTSTSAPKTSTNAAAQPAIPSRAKSPVPAKKKLLVKDYKYVPHSLDVLIFILPAGV